MADADKPELLPNGKWSYRGIEFASEEAAMSFKRSRDEGPSFAARVWETKAGKWAVAAMIFFAAVWVVSLIQPTRQVTVVPSSSFDAADALSVCNQNCVKGCRESSSSLCAKSGIRRRLFFRLG